MFGSPPPLIAWSWRTLEVRAHLAAHAPAARPCPAQHPCPVVQRKPYANRTVSPVNPQPMIHSEAVIRLMPPGGPEEGTAPVRFSCPQPPIRRARPLMFGCDIPARRYPAASWIVAVLPRRLRWHGTVCAFSLLPVVLRSVGVRRLVSVAPQPRASREPMSRGGRVGHCRSGMPSSRRTAAPARSKPRSIWRAAIGGSSAAAVPHPWCR